MLLQKKHLWYIIILLPLVIFFTAFFCFMVDAPINDDYAILDFINNCISTDSFSEKLKLIFAQHNEHRIVYDRIWTIISYKLNGNVSLTLLALLGNLSLIGVAYLFFRKFLKTNNHILVFIPISIFIFNFSSWENMTFAMATLSNFSVVLFSLLSLNFITSENSINKKNLFIAFLFFLLATLTQGAGLFIFPISVLFLIYKKQYKYTLLYLLLTLPVIFFYFHDYISPAHIDLKTLIIKYNYNILLFVFAFLGNAFNYFLIYTNNVHQSSIFASIIGFLLFCIFIFISYKKYYKKNPFIYSVMLFMILLAFTTSISRASNGLDYAGSSRYRINGIIFLCAIYFWFIDTYKIKTANILLVAASVVYLFSINLKQYENLYVRQKQVNFGILLFNSGNINYLYGDIKDVKHYESVLNTCHKLNTYNLPTNEELSDFFPFSNQHIEKDLDQSTLNFVTNIETIIEMDDSYLIEGWAYFENQNTKKQKIYIGLTNSIDNKPIYYNVKQIDRFDLNPFYQKNNLKQAGFLGRIRKNDIKKGDNKLSLMIEIKGLKKISITDKIITHQ